MKPDEYIGEAKTYGAVPFRKAAFRPFILLGVRAYYGL